MLCRCLDWGLIKTSLKADGSVNALAVDKFDADLNGLCYIACRYGVCPDKVRVKTPYDSCNVDKDAVYPGELTGYFECTSITPMSASSTALPSGFGAHRASSR
ncbi:hypothetical protein V2A60_010009 [Cordyceps javanica]